MKWTLALSWGPSGGIYAHNGYCKRLCLGRLALTLVPGTELDDLMEAYASSGVEGDDAKAGKGRP